MPKTIQDEKSFAQAFGAALIKRSKLDVAGLERALSVRGETGERFDSILTKLGLVSEIDMAEAMADYLELPLVTAKDYPDAPVLENGISTKFLKESRIIPFAHTEEGLVLAMADPLDSYVLNAMQMIVGRPVVPRVGIPADIEAAFDRLYGEESRAIDQIAEDAGGDVDFSTGEDVERLKDLASEAPVIRLVNLLIGKAVEARASDIHIEPFEHRLRVRYRIDGVLREVDAPPARLQAAVISRIKIMASLNIAERRLAQDGRIKLAIRGKNIDMRVSTVPTMYGESVVMRVLDRGSVTLDFNTLGFEERILKTYLDVLQRPDGILLVTGPTGSGKTTTLYTSLLQLNTPEKKILTVEDPIEYQLEGVNQVQVKPQIGLDFASALRSFLRQDPDIIMIGEIRDLETASIAVRAALTGHLVLSTLHTNNAASTVTRLLDMGVDDFLLTSTVNAVVAQRLVRTLCNHCRKPYPAMPELVKQMHLDHYTGDGEITLYKAEGCDECNDTGYHGRMSIMELMIMDDPLRRLVLSRATAGDLHKAAVEAGMRTMYQDGVYKALAGFTSLEEVLRVTRDS